MGEVTSLTRHSSVQGVADSICSIVNSRSSHPWEVAASLNTINVTVGSSRDRLNELVRSGFLQRLVRDRHAVGRLDDDLLSR